MGEAGIELKDIAVQIRDKLGVPATSVTAEQAPAHFGSPFMAVVFGTDAPVSSTHTQELPDRATDAPDAARGPRGPRGHDYVTATG